MPNTLSIISVAHLKHFLIYGAGNLGTVEQRPREKSAVHLMCKPLPKKSLCLAVRARMSTVAVGEKGVYPI